MKMHEKCPACTQVFEIEIGFYYGTSYVSYAMAVLLSFFTFLVWWVLIGFSLHDYRFFMWMLFNMLSLIISQPYLMRLSRAIWLSFFVSYNKNWRSERPEAPQRMGSKQVQH